METTDGKIVTVDPEVQAYVSSLVTALGGNGADEDGRYVLGDDALACLRDLKRWLRLYDEKANRLDVARCLAELNLVGGDLLQILAAWPENATDDKVKSRIALACLELLVPLTWPLDKSREMTVNHHRHTPYLQLAQLGYKRSIINFDGARILHTAVRVALPSMAEPMKERTSRDQAIIKHLLYFIRNIAMIAPPPNVAYDGDEAEVSRSATIGAFDYQDIFHLLLTLSSSMGEDFDIQDTTIMEIIFHLVKGVNIEKLFMSEVQLENKKADDLFNLRNQEAGLLRNYARTAPTRHNRFGTMIWVQRDDHKTSSVSGQDALIDSAKSLEKMDKSKKFKPPRRTPKGETGPMDFDTPVSLNVQANKQLRAFVEDFLDSGFNPLFQHIRKAIDREAERVLESHHRQFFYLVSWFLEAERVRRNSKKSKSKKPVVVVETDGFGLVAAVLNQEMFITLNRAMENSYENKSWQDLNAAMRCFTQILLTVQEMSESPLEDDQDIAENILNRIFYEETTHDRVANIVRYYKDQGFGYLNSCTELAHHYLRILENYAKQNTDLQVRSKRRTRRKKKAAREAGEDNNNNDDLEDSEGDEAHAARTSNERKFDFKRFAARFLSQGSIDTFVTFCKFYNDLNAEQLKRAHRFFYRVAFKMEMSVMLFRVDIIALFHKMIKGPEGLDPASPTYKEWDEFVKQIIKRCTRKIQERPELIVELLFSKTNSIAHYLEYGYEKQTISSVPKPAADLEVKGALEWEKQVAIVVSVLLDRNQGDHVDWVKSQLFSAEVERRTWETAHRPLVSVEQDHAAEFDTNTPAVVVEALKAPLIPLKPDNDARRTALFKNGHVRLLLTLCSFQNLVDNDSSETSWIVPSVLTADELKKSLNTIKAAEFEPPTFENGNSAEDQIRRKSAGMAASRKRAAFDDDEDNGIDDDEEEEFLFEPGGPTNMKKSDALAALKKTHRIRRRRADTEEGDEEGVSRLTDEQLDARDAAKRARELEKMRKVKSELYVRESDDESDEEADRLFYAKEEELRRRTNLIALNAFATGGSTAVADQVTSKAPAAKKRKTISGFVDSDSENEVEARAVSTRASSSTIQEDVVPVDSETGAEETDTPLSSPHVRSSQTKRRRVSTKRAHESEEDEVEEVEVLKETAGNERSDIPNTGALKDVSMVDVDDEEEDDIPVAKPVRRRAGPFVDDSDDE